LTDSPQLSPKAKSIFMAADEHEEKIVIPCIVFFELLYLTEKKRIAPSFYTLLTLVGSSRDYRVEPVCLPIIRRTADVPRDKIADPWDRIIAATALHVGLPLITRDQVFGKVGLDTIW
jgi:PIN domain nuclease of toxin-antitoxin system